MSHSPTAYGPWPIGLWLMAYGLWPTACALWRVADGLCPVTHGPIDPQEEQEELEWLAGNAVVENFACGRLLRHWRKGFAFAVERSVEADGGYRVCWLETNWTKLKFSQHLSNFSAFELGDECAPLPPNTLCQKQRFLPLEVPCQYYISLSEKKRLGSSSKRRMCRSTAGRARYPTAGKRL